MKFTSISNKGKLHSLATAVLELMKFTSISNNMSTLKYFLFCFRTNEIYKYLKLTRRFIIWSNSFRTNEIYKYLKLRKCATVEFSSFRTNEIYKYLKHVIDYIQTLNKF